MENLLKNKHLRNDLARARNCPSDQYVFIEHHKPRAQKSPYHFHPSIEINYLHDCDMTYSFSGNEFELKRQRICVFWAAYPHRAKGVNENGSITNAYVSLSEFLRWQIPSDFINQILSGAVLVSKSVSEHDRLMVERWRKEINHTSSNWQRMHVMEIQCRLNRLAIEGWEVLLPPHHTPGKNFIGLSAVTQFEKMLRFISRNFHQRLTVDIIAEVGGVSRNYAMSLFRKILGITIKEHLTDIRLFHAKMLLVDTNDKILSIAMDCGFGSNSVLYDNFQQKVGVSPAKFRKNAQRV